MSKELKEVEGNICPLPILDSNTKLFKTTVRISRANDDTNTGSEIITLDFKFHLSNKFWINIEYKLAVTLVFALIRGIKWGGIHWQATNQRSESMFIAVLHHHPFLAGLLVQPRLWQVFRGTNYKQVEKYKFKLNQGQSYKMCWTAVSHHHPFLEGPLVQPRIWQMLRGTSR